MTRILIIAGDGTASDHLDYAYFRMLEEGFEVTIAAPQKRPLKTAVHMGQPGDPIYTIERAGYIVPAQAAFGDIKPSEYDGLLLPGGRAPEYMRNMPECVEIVRHFVRADKPIGAMCHGPMLLIAAGVTGRRLSCTHDLGIEIEASGNTYVPTRGFLAEGEPDHVVDGNIVTTFRRPFHHAWIREFLARLEVNGVSRPNKVELPGKRILILAGDFSSGGQLSYAADRMREARCEVTIAAPEKKRLDTVIDMREEGWDMQDVPGKYGFENLGFWIQAHATFDEIDPSQFDGLVLPGWRATEYLRNMPSCVNAVRYFVNSDKPVGAICQSARLLLAAGVKSRRLTGLAMMKADIARVNTYVDARGEPVVDGNIVSVSGRPYYHVWTSAFLTKMQAES
jgi:protease I